MLVGLKDAKDPPRPTLNFDPRFVDQGFRNTPLVVGRIAMSTGAFVPNMLDCPAALTTAAPPLVAQASTEDSRQPHGIYSFSHWQINDVAVTRCSSLRSGSREEVRCRVGWTTNLLAQRRFPTDSSARRNQPAGPSVLSRTTANLFRFPESRQDTSRPENGFRTVSPNSLSTGLRLGRFEK